MCRKCVPPSFHIFTACDLVVLELSRMESGVLDVVLLIGVGVRIKILRLHIVLPRLL